MIDQLAIEDEVAAQIEALDPMGRLRGGNFKEALERCAYKVYGVMEEEGRAEIDDEDRGFMRKCILHLLQTTAPPRPPLRFAKFERVICNVGIPGRTWAPGTDHARCARCATCRGALKPERVHRAQTLLSIY